MAPHSSTVARKIPWMEEPGRLQSMGSLRVRHDWVTSLSLFTFMHWRRKWQLTPVFLPGESHGQRSLVGCSPWGRTESDTTEATWQQAAAITFLYRRNRHNIINQLYLNKIKLKKTLHEVLRVEPWCNKTGVLTRKGKDARAFCQVRTTAKCQLLESQDASSHQNLTTWPCWYPDLNS